MAEAPKSETEKRDEPLDLAPDAWERFEAAVDRVVKAPPQHRGAGKGCDHADQAPRSEDQ